MPRFAIDVYTINSITLVVPKKLNISVKPIVFSYEWYNGLDEPFISPNNINLA